DGQQVVELVRHAGRHSAEHFGPFRLLLNYPFGHSVVRLGVPGPVCRRRLFLLQIVRHKSAFHQWYGRRSLQSSGAVGPPTKLRVPMAETPNKLRDGELQFRQHYAHDVKTSFRQGSMCVFSWLKMNPLSASLWPRSCRMLDSRYA